MWHVALQCLHILPVPVAAERAGGCAAFVPSRGWDGRATAGCLSPVAGSHMSLIGVVVIITGVRWQLRASLDTGMGTAAGAGSG